MIFPPQGWWSQLSALGKITASIVTGLGTITAGWVPVSKFVRWVIERNDRPVYGVLEGRKRIEWLTATPDPIVMPPVSVTFVSKAVKRNPKAVLKSLTRLEKAGKIHQGPYGWSWGPRNTQPTQLIANRPEIILSWDSTNQPWAKDCLRLKNIGTSAALCVKLGQFSWPDLVWHRLVEIQSIDVGEEVSQEAQFSQRKEYRHDVGHMGRVLQSRQDSPLTLDVTFLDINSAEYSRCFTLRGGESGGPTVMVVPGPLKMKGKQND